MVCQLDTLARCRSVSELPRALLYLPKDLDDTYARILAAIDADGNHVQVFKILQLLVSSNEPVTVAEAAEIIPIELESTPQVDLERRLVDPDDVMLMCSALVIPGTQEDDTTNMGTVLRLAHFSIREFLQSTRIQGGPVGHWYIENISSHLLIARLFIAYVLFLEADAGAYTERTLPYTQSHIDYPLKAVATSRWPKHLSIAENSDSDLAFEEVQSQLFTRICSGERSWLPQLFRIQDFYPYYYPLRERSIGPQWDNVGIRRASLVFTAHHNLPRTVGFLLARGANPITISNECEALSSSFTTPLAEASRLGHGNVIKELLTHQADVEFKHENCENALKQACSGGSTEVVRLLLDHGANPNARSSPCPTALGAALLASPKPRDADTSGLVKLLLEAGANINDPVGFEW